ncbi:unnamed protein product [Effrenium voratum]|nr:unnamed protein product [Effrenium voratum]
MGQVMNCSEIVARGEYVWKIEGLSWLQNTLKQNGLCYASSEPFTVGGETFAFVYNPSAGKVSLTAEEQHGSLAIIHEDDDGITFRYRIFIKRRGGDFLQWGDTGDECHPTTDTCGWAFGPDVQQQDPCRYVPRQTGIFGLTHKQLLDSEWVENDSLTVKFELEVRPDDWYGRAPLKPHVEVPPCTFAQDMKALLDDGRCSDVEFVVQDERMTAHTAILCARSEEIVIQDCDVVTFKALLHFLYTVDELVKSMPAGSVTARKTATAANFKSLGGSGGTEELPNPRLQLLQGLLAASHKYQESITVAKVCDVLCQAHLYEVCAYFDTPSVLSV